MQSMGAPLDVDVFRRTCHEKIAILDSFDSTDVSDVIFVLSSVDLYTLMLEGGLAVSRQKDKCRASGKITCKKPMKRQLLYSLTFSVDSYCYRHYEDKTDGALVIRFDSLAAANLDNGPSNTFRDRAHQPTGRSKPSQAKLSTEPIE